MAKKKNATNNHLEEALAILIQNQASFLSRMAETDRATSERFGRIETILLDHSRVLAELAQMLERLPDAVREKIGFRAPEPH